MSNLDKCVLLYSYKKFKEKCGAVFEKILKMSLLLLKYSQMKKVFQNLEASTKADR